MEWLLLPNATQAPWLARSLNMSIYVHGLFQTTYYPKTKTEFSSLSTVHLYRSREILLISFNDVIPFSAWKSTNRLSYYIKPSKHCVIFNNREFGLFRWAHLETQLTIVYSVRNSITPVSNAVRDIGHAITVLAYILLIILPFKAFIWNEIALRDLKNYLCMANNDKMRNNTCFPPFWTVLTTIALL